VTSSFHVTFETWIIWKYFIKHFFISSISSISYQLSSTAIISFFARLVRYLLLPSLKFCMVQYLIFLYLCFDVLLKTSNSATDRRISLILCIPVALLSSLQILQFCRIKWQVILSQLCIYAKMHIDIILDYSRLFLLKTSDLCKIARFIFLTRVRWFYIIFNAINLCKITRFAFFKDVQTEGRIF